MPGATPDPAGPLFGRDSELRLITSLLDGIRKAGAALVLRGEPGIGKSRLLAEAIALARERRMAILTTSGVQSESRLAFSGLHQLIRPLRSAAATLPPAPRAALDMALNLGDEAVPGNFRVAMAVLDLLSDVATDAPLLVVVDDAHWLDRASSDVLAFVARRLESDPITLLVATRDGSPALTDAGLRELRLDALGPEVAAELLDASARDLTTVMRERLLSDAAGNPLALIELPVAAARLDPGSPVHGSLPLTERLERAFAARVSELPDDTRLLLMIAALNDGDDVDEVLQAAGSIVGKAMDLDALEPAVRSAIIDLDLRTVRFRHPLMRSAVRQDATVRELRRAHEALAGILDAEPDRRVWHCAALISGVDEDVATDLAEAGLRAWRRGATGEAFAAVRRAAELGEPARRGRRLLDAAQLAHELGQPEAVLPLLREVEQLSPGTAERARATWIEEVVDPRPLSNTARAAALIDAAESAGRVGDRDLHIDLLWVVAVRAWWTDPGSAVRRLLVEASDRLGGADAADPRVFAIHAYADSLGHTPAVVARLRAVAAEGCRDTDAARYFSEAALVVGAFDLAMTFLDVAVQGLRAEGRLGQLPRTLALHGFVAARLADWDVAIPAAEESRRLGEEFGEALAEARVNNLVAMIAGARVDNIVAMIAGMRGDAKDSERASANAERVGLSMGAHATIAFAQGGRVLAALGAGRHADAYRFAERLFDPTHPAHHVVVSCWHIGDLAEAALHDDRVEQARARLAQV
ncbi:MAG: AAA family ATPase, partial [Pseudolysinimonas sp.]